MEYVPEDHHENWFYRHKLEIMESSISSHISMAVPETPKVHFSPEFFELVWVRLEEDFQIIIEETEKLWVKWLPPNGCASDSISSAEPNWPIQNLDFGRSRFYLHKHRVLRRKSHSWRIFLTWNSLHSVSRCAALLWRLAFSTVKPQVGQTPGLPFFLVRKDE